MIGMVSKFVLTICEDPASTSWLVYSGDCYMAVCGCELLVA